MITTWGIGYTESRKRAKIIYAKIGRIPCPVFNGEMVAFNKKGFNHLLRRGQIKRPQADRLRRLRLLEYAENIIKMPVGRIQLEFQEKEIEQWSDKFGNKVREKKKAKAWTFIQEIDGCKVKLVVGQVDGGGKEFLSIMCRHVVLHEEDKKDIAREQALRASRLDL